MKSNTRRFVSGLALSWLLVFSTAAEAHFPWLVINSSRRAEFFFGEELTDRTYKLPPTIAKAEVQVLHANGSISPLPVKRVESDDFVGLAATDIVDREATLVSRVTYGLYHGARLDYYALHQGLKPLSAEQLSAAKLRLHAPGVPRRDKVDVRKKMAAPTSFCWTRNQWRNLRSWPA